MNFAEDILRTIDRVARALGHAQAPWAIGGSLASVIHGEPRSTNDVDFVAGLRRDRVEAFVGLGQLARRRRVELIAGFEVFVLGPEDTVLQKLRWYLATAAASPGT